MQNVHGKEIDLLRTTVKVPGKRLPRATAAAPGASPKANGLSKERSSTQLAASTGKWWWCVRPQHGFGSACKNVPVGKHRRSGRAELMVRCVGSCWESSGVVPSGTVWLEVCGQQCSPAVGVEYGVVQHHRY